MYSGKVLIGNWNEDLELQKVKVAEYIKKRDNKELIIQKIRTLFHNMCRGTQLCRTGNYVEFGNRIQLFAPDVPSFCPKSENKNFGVIVSVTIPKSAIGKIERFTDEMPIVCAAKNEPCTRNTFMIQSPDSNNRDGKNLLFGENFVLQLSDSPEEDLYVRSVTPHVDDTRGPGEHNRVLLSNIKDCYCLWKVLLCDKNMRFEAEGSPVPVSTRVIITHVMTGECLAVEGLGWQSSIFGVECGISVHIYRDVNKRETSECHWMFITEELPRGTDEKCQQNPDNKHLENLSCKTQYN